MCVMCGCGGNGKPGVALGDTAGPVVDGRGDLHFGAGAARVSVPGMSQSRAVKLEADILGANNEVAAHNRAHFRAHGVRALNLVSSPGSGKTTLLCATIERLRQSHPALPIAVIEGDQETSFDADRIRATGAPAVQVNTGKGCHLDAPMVSEAFAQLHRHDHDHEPHHPHHDHHHHGDHHSHDHGHDHGHAYHHPHPGDEPASLLFIENVGNLVCPALWDLGEEAKVAILSVTEGEDKPLKYPDMFAAAQLMILNKTDLLPHVRFDVDRCVELARRVNPAIEVIQLSATTGAGMEQWEAWLMRRVAGVAVRGPEGREQALRRQIEALQAELAGLGQQSPGGA